MLRFGGASCAASFARLEPCARVDQYRRDYKISSGVGALCTAGVADTDMSCAVQLKNQGMPANSTGDFLLRFAVSEAESWLLADREAIALFFGIAETNIPRNPDSLDDPKLEILRLARRSSGMLRREMISPWDLQKPGSGYNIHLQKFAREKWRPIVARHHSESLNRALLDVARLGRVTNH